MCIFCSNLYSICISVNPALLLSFCLSVCLTVCLSACLSVCLFVCVPVCLFLCLRSSTDLILSLSVVSTVHDYIFPLSRMCPLKDHHDNIGYQTAYIADLVKETNYGFDLDSSKFFHAWYKSKLTDVMTYRDQSYRSKFTGTKSLLHHTPLMKAFDDSMQGYLSTKD